VLQRQIGVGCANVSPNKRLVVRLTQKPAQADPDLALCAFPNTGGYEPANHSPAFIGIAIECPLKALRIELPYKS
jgi:hypothetical protein